MKRRVAGVVALGGLATVIALAPGPTAPPPVGLGATSNVACSTGGAFDTPGIGKASTSITGTQVAKVAYRAGFRGDDLVIAVAVAKAESDWNPSARNANTNGSTDLGLFQINTVHAAILARGTWSDAAANAEMAYQVYTDAGSSWRPWVTYWRGTYRQHLAAAQAAVAGVADAAAAATGCSRDVVAAGALSDPGPGAQGADGMRPRAVNVRALTKNRWGCKVRPAPCISYIGGYAKRNISGTGTPSDHATGNAVDIMLGPTYKSVKTNELGWEIADFWAENMKVYGGKYVIYDNNIRTLRDKTWRPYTHPGCGGDTCQHVDHVHVSVQ